MQNPPFLLFWLLGLMLAYSGYATPRETNSSRPNLAGNAATASPAGKLALVIGNDYADEAISLKHPVQDADDLRKALRGLGFEVMGENRQSLEEMNRLLDAFGKRLQPGMVGLFYFAGYSLRVQHINYLIPTGSKIQRVEDLSSRALDASRIMTVMETAQARLKLLFLDASRNYPLQQPSDARSLATMEVPLDALVAFAAEPGSQSLDGEGPNSLYTGALLKQMLRPGMKIEETLKRVRIEVARSSGRQQIPWEESGLLADFCFAGCTSDVPAKSVQVQTVPPSAPSTEPSGLSPAVEYPEMIRLPGGTFWMGSPEDENGRESGEARHQVTLMPFAISKHEITRGQFRTFVKATGYRADSTCWTLESKELKHRAERDWRSPGYDQNDEHPVVCISAQDATAYARWLSERTGQSYRLPTEAEWEYAARAGAEGAHYWDKYDNPCAYMNAADKTAQGFFDRDAKSTVHDCEDTAAHTARVGTYRPNRFNLYDMLGNVWEWTCSAFDETYSGAETRCSNDVHARLVYRGGSWLNQPARLRLAQRYADERSFRIATLGFRLAQD